MDAVDFLKGYKRLCTYNANNDRCGKNCEFYAAEICGGIYRIYDDAGKTISILENWLKEHPNKTRQSEFLKIFPEVPLDREGIPQIHPCDLGKKYIDKKICETKPCAFCRKEFWCKEIE